MNSISEKVEEEAVPRVGLFRLAMSGAYHTTWRKGIYVMHVTDGKVIFIYIVN
jgi:hypothetical protein